MNEQPPFDAAALLDQLLHQGAPPGDEQQRAPLQWIDMSCWDRDPVPERKWAIKDLSLIHI